MQKIIDILFSHQDMAYRDFQAKLMPTVNKENIIGVRTPVLRKIAKAIAATQDAEQFINCLPHKYYEENNLHAFILESIKDHDRLVHELDKFFPYIDNWATCDSMSPAIIKKHTDMFVTDIYKWINGRHTYSVRFGILCLMRYFLEDDTFDKCYLEAVAQIRSDEYYIKMMQAWFFATALAKQYDHAIIYLEKGYLDTWVHNKTIQKAVESYRISVQDKQHLKLLKKRSEC